MEGFARKKFKEMKEVLIKMNYMDRKGHGHRYGIRDFFRNSRERGLRYAMRIDDEYTTERIRNNDSLLAPFTAMAYIGIVLPIFTPYMLRVSYLESKRIAEEEKRNERGEEKDGKYGD
jgi:hypothetical protein